MTITDLDRPAGPSDAVDVALTASVHTEVLDFYARQVRVLDALDVDGFVATFTEDAVLVHAHRDERVQGRATLAAGARRGVPLYDGVKVRHWFQQFVVQPRSDGTIAVSYYTLVSRVDRAGAITFEPSYTADDVLVRVDGALQVASRIVDRDLPA